MISNLISVLCFILFVAANYYTNIELLVNHKNTFEWISGISVVLYLIPISFLFACHPCYQLPCQRYDDFEREALTYPLDRVSMDI